MSLARYSFLPWVRRGLANKVAALPASGYRPSLDVTAVVESNDSGDTPKSITRTVQLNGPGDVVGISAKAIIRTHPPQWAANFLPNYLPFIEFYDEDFPWRHSPALPSAVPGQLQPWLAIAVLEANEFSEAAATGPLPAFQLAPSADPNEVLPAWAQLALWAHVHVNHDLVGTDTPPLSPELAAQRLDALTRANPDLAYSRLMGSRHLKPDTAYDAFVIPAFETGRLAGLGLPIPPSSQDPAQTQILTPAWGGGQKTFPYYHRWHFGTSHKGDFESLAKLVRPRPVDPRVGVRAMDVSAPGGDVRAPYLGANKPALLGLEGALRSPQTASTPWPVSHPDPFQSDLADFVNAAETMQAATPTDPVITPPLYGCWHALKRTVTAPSGTAGYDANAKWLTELNLDPRYRAAAGLGARVVHARREELMNEMWSQVGDVLAANRSIKLAQMATAASLSLHVRHLTALPVESGLAVTAPVINQLYGSEETIACKLGRSALPDAMLLPEFRRAVRPRGALARRAFPEARGLPQRDFLARANAGTIAAAAPRPLPPGAITLAGLAEAVRPAWAPAWLTRLVQPKWRAWLVLLLAAAAVVGLFLINMLSPAAAATAGAGLLAAAGALRALHRQADAQAALQPAAFGQAAVQSLAPSASFRITRPDGNVSPGGDPQVDALRFKQALADFSVLVETAPPQPPVLFPADIGHLYREAIRGLDPAITIIRRTSYSIGLIGPGYESNDLGQWAETPIETFVPVMAYPDFPRPMYEALRDLSAEYLIPNVSLVPDNTVSLLAANQKFIEAYMVGLNHEMGRLALWNEFPFVDQRASYFRQFWDASAAIVPANLTAAQRCEMLKDIPEIHLWPRATPLGSHNHRVTPSGSDPAVFLLRAQLLKMFPNTFVYAHRAVWQTNSTTGLPAKAASRRLAATATAAEQDQNIRLPLYSARIEPDIYFLGFDLTIAEAVGDNNNPGWFLVFRERLGEPQFGLDVGGSATAQLASWDDLSWGRLGTVPGAYILLPPSAAIVPSNSGGLTLSSASNSADIASILYQDPVLIAMHAQSMLAGVTP